MNPYDLRGPEFLGLYAFLILLAAPAAAWLRVRLNGPAGEPDQAHLQLPPLEAALLAGGARRAFDAAVVRLASAGLLEVDATGRTLCPRGTPRGASAMERAVLEAASPAPGYPIADVWSRVQGAAAVGEARLASLGLRPSGLAAQLAPAVVLGNLALFGLGKVVVGVGRGRPVGFLAVLVAGVAIASLWLLLGRPARSRLGSKVLSALRRRNDGLRSVGQAAAPADAALAVALFDLPALAASPLSPVALALRPPPPATGDSSDVWWMTSGGSGCASSGCGGGGGGGGCGGCGS